MWYSTSRTSIILFSFIYGFVFISIDTIKSPLHHLTPGLPTPNFWRILRLVTASNERGRLMGALAPAVRIRHDLHTRLIQARSRTDEIFRIVREEAMYDRPIP